MWNNDIDRIKNDTEYRKKLIQHTSNMVFWSANALIVFALGLLFMQKWHALALTLGFVLFFGVFLGCVAALNPLYAFGDIGARLWHGWRSRLNALKQRF